MDKKHALEILNSLIDDVQSIPYPEEGRVEQETLKAKNVAKELFPNNDFFTSRIDAILFTPTSVILGRDNTRAYRSSLEKGQKDLVGIIRAMVSQVETFYPEDEPLVVKAAPIGNDVFIVHGHDDEMIHAVARTVNKLGYNPIILREQPDHGRTIIEKFEDHSNVVFVIVLLAPDDEILLKDKSLGEYSIEKTRTRQNVLFEMGFLIGKLGRNRVAVLHRQSDKFEFPSDYSGVLYKIFDDAGGWQFEIGKEMKAAGLEVDLNKIA